MQLIHIDLGGRHHDEPGILMEELGLDLVQAKMGRRLVDLELGHLLRIPNADFTCFCD